MEIIINFVSIVIPKLRLGTRTETHPRPLLIEGRFEVPSKKRGFKGCVCCFQKTKLLLNSFRPFGAKFVLFFSTRGLHPLLYADSPSGLMYRISMLLVGANSRWRPGACAPLYIINHRWSQEKSGSPGVPKHTPDPSF